MRRRIVFSVDSILGESSTIESAGIVCSEGMKMASSFATRFQLLALVPWAAVFTSGTPVENGHFYCDSPMRRELLESIKSASLISIKLRHAEADAYDGKDKRAIVCEIIFRRSSVVFKTMKFFFRLIDGENIQSSLRDHCDKERIRLLPPDDMENALEDIENAIKND